MIEKLDAIGNEAEKAIADAASLDALEHLRVSVLGKKGSLSEVLRGLGSVSAEERPKIGAVANLWKQKIERVLDERLKSLQSADLTRKLQSEKIDVTLPGRTLHRGTLHPITQTRDLLVSVFSKIGFEVTTGPEVETE